MARRSDGWRVYFSLLHIFFLFIWCPTSHIMLLQVVPAISMLTRSVYSLHAPKNNIKAPPSETLTQAQAMDTLREIGCRMQCMPHIPIPFRWFCACPVSYVIFSYSRIWGAPTVMCHRKYRSGHGVSSHTYAKQKEMTWIFEAKMWFL